MYLRSLSVENLKLLHRVELPFTREDGSWRQWTVFVGENGSCKTSLLRAIALAASGPERGNQLAGDLTQTMRDKRWPNEAVSIAAKFDFHPSYHENRVYPGYDKKRPTEKPRLLSRLSIAPGQDVLRGRSYYVDEHDKPIPIQQLPSGVAQPQPTGQLESLFDPLLDARARNLNHWFVAGYGIGRHLPAPQSTGTDRRVPTLDRLRSLFDLHHQIIGTDFAGRFSADETLDFVKLLQEAFVDHGVLLNIARFELRGRGGISKAIDLVESHRFEQMLGRDHNHRLKVPATALSQGYQGTIAWVADLIGQVLLEAQTTAVPLREMEGIVLIDELDLHLHPKWQRGLARSLTATFPKMQFIVTTHSPMILPGFSADEIFHLHQDSDGNILAEPASVPPKNMSGTEIYDAFFDIRQVRSREIEDALDDFGRLALNPFRTEEDEVTLQNLLARLRSDGVVPRWVPVPRKEILPSPNEGDSNS